MNSEFLELIRSRQRFLLSGHEHPDGDCLGAQVALYHLLQELGASPRVFNPDPVANSLAFLAETTPIANHRESPDVPEFDVAVLLDCASLSRLGNLGQVVRGRGATIAVIDHHVGSEDGDGDPYFVDTTAAATGVLVHDLYETLGVPVSPVAAEAIFVSIVSDTGWFKYSNTDPKTMRIAAAMIERGVAPDRLYDRLNRDHDPRSIGILADALGRHETRVSGKFGYTVLSRDLMIRVGHAGFDTDHVLEPIRSVRDVEVAGLFKCISGSQTKMSLRSMGDVDVQAIAAELGGGGHKKAAGATVALGAEETVAAVQKLVEEALENG